jgi:hypothetical protein
MRKGQWPQQHGIQDAEDGRGCADAQRQRQDSGRGEARAVAKLAKRVAQRMEHSASLPVFTMHAGCRSNTSDSAADNTVQQSGTSAALSAAGLFCPGLDSLACPEQEQSLEIDASRLARGLHTQ